jgi:hypothetical protein
MKNAKLNDKHLEELNALYYTDSVSDSEFKQRCIEVIENSRVPNQSILRKINNHSTTRIQALYGVINFVFKGTGDGVR